MNVGRECEPFWVAALSDALRRAGDAEGALQTAQESVRLVRQYGSDLFIPVCYRVLADALLASDEPERIAEAQHALERATAAVEETGARAELPFIERARGRLALVS
jgi:hypothetical protein